MHMQTKHRNGRHPLGTLARSIGLLRGTRLWLSLFRFRFSGMQAAAAAELAGDLFDGRGLLHRSRDGAFLLLVPRFDPDADALTRRIEDALRAAVTVPCTGSGADAAVELVALHCRADAVGNPDDLLLELAAQSPRLIAPHRH